MTHEDALAMIDALKRIVSELFGLGCLLFAILLMLGAISKGVRGPK